MGFIWEKVIRPAAFAIDAETAHESAIRMLAAGLSGKAAQRIARRVFNAGDWPPVECFGLKFPNPIGLAAGFDKNGVATAQLAALGFGFIEVGTVTLLPQAGNAKPRLFRLPDDAALINRMGFNNDGAAAIAERLSKLHLDRPVGVNIGRNKDVTNEAAEENYVKTFQIVAPFADYVVVNVSSPNTPGLRNLQQADSLDNLLKALGRANSELPSPKPLLVKVSPDLDESDIKEIADVCLGQNVSGIIATNTTLSRSELTGSRKFIPTEGGLSGRPLQKTSNQTIATLYGHLRGRIKVIGAGGIMSVEDAFAKIAAGASLLQVYTGFVYGGPFFPSVLSRGLLRMLGNRGFSSLDEAVGSSFEQVRTVARV